LTEKVEGTVEGLESRVLEYINKNDLFFPGEKVIVAVSGGPDSVCLLNILFRLKSRLGIDLHVVHLNHQLRDKESDADSRYVARMSKRLQVPSTIEKQDVSAYRRKMGISMEEAARELRYEFFARIASEEEAACVAVAHNQNDNVETILLHILRGTGIAGLRGLQPKQVLQLGEDRLCVNIVRPLLNITREETVEYCSKIGLKPRIDSSNRSLKFTRNRIRHQLLPELKTYNPRIDDALLRLSNIAKEEISFLEELTAQLWSDNVEELGNALSIDIKRTLHLPPVVQRQLLRWSVKYLSGNIKDIEAEHVEEMLDFMQKPSGKTLQLPHGLRLHTEYGRLIMNMESVIVCPFSPIRNTIKLKIPGETPVNDWLMQAQILKSTVEKYDQGFTALFDLAKTGKDLEIRTSRQGDSFQPLGMKQAKSLSHFMADSKIPGTWRASVPLVCADDKIVWVVGWRIDDSVKITPDTRKILRLEFTRKI
jgi:tRNA(Ile)-lysidine synthase